MDVLVPAKWKLDIYVILKTTQYVSFKLPVEMENKMEMKNVMTVTQIIMMVVKMIVLLKMDGHVNGGNIKKIGITHTVQSKIIVGMVI